MLVKRLLSPIVAAIRRRTGSINTVRFIYGPEGKTTLYPAVEISTDCFFEGNNFVHGPTILRNTSIGSYSYIGGNCKIGNTNIGRFCSIASEVVIGLGKHPTSGFVSTHPVFYSPDNKGFPVCFSKQKLFKEFDEIEIGNDVWIGYRAIISDGVKIGSGAIIAAGSVVTHDVEPYSIVGGIPARHIRYRFDNDTIDGLLKMKWWDKDISWIRANADKFKDVNVFTKTFTTNQI
ncbi:MAG: CatB-related O-acetyltransferase [Desulfuromonadaceae bacterium]|nr:CatB-related O-acetyltransferase [Desulfuromonadaceae bacterium]